MLGSHLIYVTLFSSNVYMLVIYICLCYTICQKPYTCYCSPWHIMFKKTHDMHVVFFCLQYAWTYVIVWHVIWFHSLQCYHRSFMVGYHDHVSIASSQRDCVSQSFLSQDYLANWCGRRSSCYFSPLSETRHGWATLYSITYHPNSSQTTRVDFFFLFFYPWIEVGTNRWGCLLIEHMSAGDQSSHLEDTRSGNNYSLSSWYLNENCSRDSPTCKTW